MNHHQGISKYVQFLWYRIKLYIDQHLGQPEINTNLVSNCFKTSNLIKTNTDRLGYITLFASFLFNNVVIESVKLWWKLSGVTPITSFISASTNISKNNKLKNDWKL